MIADTEALIRKQIDLCWEEEASRIRLQTEAHIARELDRLTQRGTPSSDALSGLLARAIRAEGIRLAVRRLQIALKTIAEVPDRITSDQMAFIEDTVRATLKQWIAHRTPYLRARLQAVSSGASDLLPSEVSSQVTRAVARELEITKARFLLAQDSPEGAASIEELARAHVLKPGAKNLLPDPELADRLARLDPALADSYLQVASDLSHTDRISYLGPLSELRSIVTTAIRKLAPDDEDICQWLSQMAEAPDHDGRRPSRSQRVRFIKYRQQPTANGNDTARALGNLLDNMVPGFISKWHDRGSSGDSCYSGRDEALRIFAYADSLLRDLLPASGPARPSAPTSRAQEKRPAVLDDSLLQTLHPTWYS